MMSAQGSFADAPPLPPTLEQLLAVKTSVADEYVALKEQLDRLILAHHNREKICASAIADLKAQYQTILERAKDEAAGVVAAAHFQASIVATNSANAELVAKKKIDEAEVTAKQMIFSAEVEAKCIVQNADATSRGMQDAAAEECKMMEDAVLHERAKWEAEKARILQSQKFEPIVKLNVGGSRFDTSHTTLTRFPDSMIGTMFNGRHTLVLDKEGYHFIDRDGTHFRYILNFLRSPESFILELAGPGLVELRSECDFYGLTEHMFPTTV
jgi:vacuolar-type H+-ATPase subunit H